MARSRDASPHRIETTTENLTRPTSTTYSIHNNLLSPPNLVPLPPTNNNNNSGNNKTMAENTFKLLEEFYSSNILSKDSLLSGNLFGKDAVDNCIQTKCISFEKTTSSSTTTSTATSFNGSYETTNIKKEYTNGVETKSFIQQRVERLYGPGALAQGFLCKRNKNRSSESWENGKENSYNNGIHSKSFNGAGCDENNAVDEPTMKQSTSSPTLPVLRHLRPEFRAQLPIISPRKGIQETTIQKSITIPKLKEETKVNGHVNGHGKVEDKIKGVKEAVIELADDSGMK